MTIHTFEDVSPHREDDLLAVEEIDVEREDDPMLFAEYGGAQLLQFSTDDSNPWLELDTVVRLRDMLTEWIEQHPDNQPTSN